MTTPSYELRALIASGHWPNEAIAAGARLPLNVVVGFMDEDKYPAAADMARLTAWAELHTGIAGSGAATKVFDTYRGVQAFAHAVSSPVMKGKPLLADCTLRATDEEQTLANQAAAIAGKAHENAQGSTGNITPDKAHKLAKATAQKAA